MRRVLSIFLFGALLLSAFAYSAIAPQHAFAASKVVTMHSVPAHHLLSRKYYAMGYRDGRKAGYDDGLTSCQENSSGQKFAASRASINESYDLGFDRGYKSGYEQGQQECEADQVGGGGDNGNGGGDNGGGGFDNGGSGSSSSPY